jgi:hypothetical protein
MAKHPLPADKKNMKLFIPSWITADPNWENVLKKQYSFLRKATLDAISKYLPNKKFLGLAIDRKKEGDHWRELAVPCSYRTLQEFTKDNPHYQVLSELSKAA